MSDDPRSAALNVFLERRSRDGFEVETRTATQAVIVRRRRLFAVLRAFRAGAGDIRLVVSVDRDGAVSTVAAEPRRW